MSLRFPVMAPFTAVNGGVLRSGAEDAANQVLSIVAGASALVGVVANVETPRRARLGRKLRRGLAVAFGTGLFTTTNDSSFTHVYSAAIVAGLVVFGAFRLLAAGDEPHDTRAQLVRRRARRVRARRFPGRDPAPVVPRPGRVVDGGGVRRLAARAPVLAPPGRDHGRRRCGDGDRRRESAGVQPLRARKVDAVVVRGEHFSLERFHQLDVFASLQKGLVTWYPLVVVIVLVAAWARNWAGIGLLLGLVAPLVLLYGAWHAWTWPEGWAPWLRRAGPRVRRRVRGVDGAAERERGGSCRSSWPAWR